MKILIRQIYDEYYVWKDAEWKHDGYHIVHDGEECFIHERLILATKDDNRKGKVICQYCGEIIDDNPEAIERHFANQEAKRNCLTCKDLGTYGSKSNIKINYTSNEDGTYHEVVSSDTKLRCKMSAWTTIDISSNDAKRICRFNQCRIKGVKEIKDFFTEYPDAFYKQITVDFLIKKGFTYKGHHGGYFQYDLKLRNALYACVNEVGVVDHFIVKHRNDDYTAYYSEKYDKLFFDVRNCYSDATPGYMSEVKHKNAKEKIAALYKEANK